MKRHKATEKTTLVIGFPEYQAQAERFARAAGLTFRVLDIHRFPDGESLLKLPTLLPQHVVFIRSLDHPNDKLVEIILAAKGARSLGASKITLISPYLCYMRQDKAFHAGEVVSQQVIGSMLADYFDVVLSVDAHLHRIHCLADVMPGIIAENISATEPIAQFIEKQITRPYLLGPDSESEQWVSAIARYSGIEKIDDAGNDKQTMDYAVCSKQRISDTEVRVALPEGNYRGRNMVLVDDMASTGKTLLATAIALKKYQPASISVIVTHALFDEHITDSLIQAGVNNVWSCDSISHPSNVVELADTLVKHFFELDAD